MIWVRVVLGMRRRIVLVVLGRPTTSLFRRGLANKAGPPPRSAPGAVNDAAAPDNMGAETAEIHDGDEPGLRLVLCGAGVLKAATVDPRELREALQTSLASHRAGTFDMWPAVEAMERELQSRPER
jgi:hypothetical protein